MVQWHDEGLSGLTYDDVLIRPAYSQLDSRLSADVYTTPRCPTFGRISPIIVANMASTATDKMIMAMDEPLVMVPSHRFQDIKTQTAQACLVMHAPSAASVGLADKLRWLELLNNFGIEVLFLELAHADTRAAIAEIKEIKYHTSINKITLTLVVGNVATADACRRLFDAGADIVKVGVGPGAVCTTRLVTGCGVPQLSAVLECAPCGPIIADGGIRTSGDCVKALAAGAKFVMVGSLFAGTDEAGGDVSGGSYFGMASEMGGKVRKGTVPEGISTHVSYRGGARKVVEDLMAGIRQGMAMVGAKTLEELRERAVFQRVSPATVIENQPHIKFGR